MHEAQRHINHVALVLDASSSMTRHVSKVVEVADDQIRHLALRSEELSQETRVSIYTFADNVKCLIFDMDVMRLPSIKDLYKVYGWTALIDAAIKSQEDLATTSRLYGDHAFLTFIITDGDENRSRHARSALEAVLFRQPDAWNVAWLVPNKTSEAYVTRLGVDPGNIAIWDTQSAEGFVGVGRTIKAATESFMTSRGTGRSWASKGVFGTGSDRVNAKTVHSTLNELPSNGLKFLQVFTPSRIDDRVNQTGINYRIGMGFYELSKREEIQPQKEIIIVEKKNGRAFGGQQARDLLNLPNHSVRVTPDENPDYKIFVQSTSVNRKLVPGTELLVRV